MHEPTPDQERGTLPRELVAEGERWVNKADLIALLRNPPASGDVATIRAIFGQLADALLAYEDQLDRELDLDREIQQFLKRE